MPKPKPKPKSAHAKRKSGGGKGKSAVSPSTKQGASVASSAVRVKRVSHLDPYLGVVGSTIDELVVMIESKDVSIAPAADEQRAAKRRQKRNKQRKMREAQAAAALQQTEGVTVKTGMTKEQLRNLQNRRKQDAQRCRQRPGGDGDGTNADGGDKDDDGDDDDDEENNQAGSGEDYSDTANERAKEYRKGGYHPVVVNDLYHNRYRIIKKLGWGYFSTVWLVWDYKEERFQAMKVQKSAEHYREAAFDEIKLLSEIMGADPKKTRCCARLNDYFEHAGPNGVHVCMVFDVYGENLLSLMERYEYNGIPIPIVKCIARQVLIGLEHLHSLDIIHTDLKPENVLLSMPKHSIISLMRRYTPAPLNERPSLLDRDPKTMTKSQRRRFYKKLREKELGGAEKNGAAATTDDGDAEDPQRDDGAEGGATAPQPENGQCSGDSGNSGAGGETVGKARHEHRGSVPDKREEGAPVGEASASETDPEWEVERFHHVVVADFGNSCWIDRQFTDEVQTRQYRSPEVILGDGYSTPIDLWSFACMIFELITGEFLFDPKRGENYSRDEDHLALMTELLGELPESMRIGNGKYRANFYNSRGQLRHIDSLNFWCLEDVLHQKHKFTRAKAREIAEFLLPMLELDPRKRATATEMLEDFDDFFVTKEDDYTPMCFVDADAKGREQVDGSDDGSEDEEEGRDAADYTADSYDEESWDDDSDETASDDSGERGDGGGSGLQRKYGLRALKKKSSAAAVTGRVRHAGSCGDSDMVGGSGASLADDPVEMQKWCDRHPFLNKRYLAERGLTVFHVKQVLNGEELESPELQEAANDIIRKLSLDYDADTASQDPSHSDGDGHNADCSDYSSSMLGEDQLNDEEEDAAAMKDVENTDTTEEIPKVEEAEAPTAPSPAAEAEDPGTVC